MNITAKYSANRQLCVYVDGKRTSFAKALAAFTDAGRANLNALLTKHGLPDEQNDVGDYAIQIRLCKKLLNAEGRAIAALHAECIVIVPDVATGFQIADVCRRELDEVQVWDVYSFAQLHDMKTWFVGLTGHKCIWGLGIQWWRNGTFKQHKFEHVDYGALF